jgi:phage baseplate assembly protein W
MAQNIYRGFSTIGVRQRNSVYDTGGLAPVVSQPSNTVKISDEAVVTRDLLNAFNIKQGEIPGNPAYGTIIHGFIFEPNIENVRSEMEQEIRRVASLDPRITVDGVKIQPQDNQVLFQLEVRYEPFNDPQTVNMGIDKISGQVSQVG